MNSWLTPPPICPGSASTITSIQTEAGEDPLVRLVHDAVRLAHAVIVAVDRVRVLHQELATAKQPEPRPELVAVLPLDLVDVLRQVAVRRQVTGREQRDDLLLRGAEDQLAIVAVGELEQVVAVQVVATGGAPRTRGKQDRHPDLLRAGRVHLLAHDRLDLAHRSQAHRHRCVDAGHDLADETATQQQAVARDVGVGRILAERGREHL